MQIIRLNRIGSGPIYVNADKITHIELIEPGTTQVGLSLAAYSLVNVSDTPEEIMEKIEMSAGYEMLEDPFPEFD